MAAHDELRELTGVYVLGVLGGTERAEFEAHLRSCEACTAEVRSLGAVVQALTGAVPHREPPAMLRERLLESVSGRAALPSTGRSTGEGRVRSRWLDAPGWLAAAAAAIVAAWLGWYALGLRQRVSALEARLAEVTNRGTVAERQVADLRRTALETQSTLAILSAPDLARIELSGQPVSPSARARAFWSRARGLVFTASNLPAPPPGKIYQLWVVTSDAPISAGLLTPDAAGQINAVIATPPDLPTPVAMAVTLEPAGGVPAPTGDKYLLGTPSTGI